MPLPYPLNPLGISVREELPLTLTAVETSTVRLMATGSPTVAGLHYRLGTSGPWIAYPIGTEIPLAAGKKVQFWNSATRLGTSSSNYCKFVLEGTLAARGNALSLINFSSNCYAWSFYGLFSGASSLISPPQIPASVLGESSCRGMFEATSITEPPDITAATLVYSCCRGMFRNCAQMTKFPKFSASLVNGDVFYAMCENDTSLSSVDLSSFTNLRSSSFTGMLRNCSNVNQINVSFTSWTYNGNAATTAWVSGVAASGTFFKPSTLPEEYGVSRIPEGFTVINK